MLSDAALRVASSLDAPYHVLGALAVVPKWIREGVYELVARTRYRVFGKKDQCERPPQELMERFVKDGV